MITSSIWLATILSVLVVSFISLIGIFALSDQLERLRKRLLFLVSFAAGAMTGDVFIHLLPELNKEAGTFETASIWILVGIILFFMLEKFIYWRHCHIPTSEQHPHQMGLMNVIGDGLHNFLDGAIIAGSFMVSVPLGIATTTAVILHEIPQEIGDFGILLHAGYSKMKALLFNYLSALAAVVGAIVALIVGQQIEGVTTFLIPITIGGFLYIALSDLLPQIHQEPKTSNSIKQFAVFIFGIVVMSLLLLLE